MFSTLVLLGFCTVKSLLKRKNPPPQVKEPPAWWTCRSRYSPPNFNECRPMMWVRLTGKAQVFVMFEFGLRGPNARIGSPENSMRGTMETGRASEKDSGKPRLVASKGDERWR